jgi:hypothetical protein
VKAVQTKVNEEDIEDVLATGSIPEILKFMRAKNISGGEGSVKFNLRQVYWLCKDKTFYTEGLKIIRSKNIFDKVFWSFSILHLDQKTMTEYFSS